MPDTTAVDEVWEWLYTPLKELKEDYTTNSDKSWEDRRRAFIEQLGLSDPADHPVTGALITKLDEMSADDRTGLLTTDEIDTVAYEFAQRYTPQPEPAVEESVPEPAAEATPEAGYDEDAWNTFAKDNLTAWNGDDGAWEQFVTWFNYHADQAGLAAPAKALLDYAAGLSDPERIAMFAQYGATIAPAAVPVEETGDGAGTEEQTAMMDEILKERPEFAALSEERRRELVAQVLAEPDEDDEEGED